MKIQVRRNVFETNSSSVHTLSIIKNSDVTTYPAQVTFGSGEFGWENRLYTSTKMKAAYLWECLTAVYSKSNDDLQNAINTITENLKKHNIEAIFLFNNIKQESFTYNGRTHIYNVYTDEAGNNDKGYVDHGSEAEVFIYNIVKDEKKLLNFLFDNKSWVLTGNDNQDDCDFLETPNSGDSWEYEKGN